MHFPKFTDFWTSGDWAFMLSITLGVTLILVINAFRAPHHPSAIVLLLMSLAMDALTFTKMRRIRASERDQQRGTPEEDDSDAADA